MIISPILEVTSIEPRLKHPTIFKHFDALASGESFIIHNDHDPKPLYYQLLGERGDIFTWEYLEQGPESWRVKIAKKTAQQAEATVGEIAAKDYRKAEVFKKMGIDFCCGGNKTLSEASREAGVSEQELNTALEQAGQQAASAPDYNKWDIGFLSDYIIQTHHRYVKENAEIIYGLAHKVAQHHGSNHPELIPLADKTKAFLQDLMSHMAKEENILFPRIKKLQERQSHKGFGDEIPVGFFRNAIQMMEDEHAASGEDLEFFRKLTYNYSLPEDACNSYRYLFEKMKEFENDLFTHIHLENNILFPKAIATEEELAGV